LLLSRAAKAFARGILGLKPQDCTGGYRCYARPLVTFLEGSNVAAHGYSALIELLLLCQRAGYSISEVPITFVDRVLGTSKVSSAEIFRGLTTVLRLRFKRGTGQAGPAPTRER
ncbi:MAG: hypothetical protein M3O87_00985, partial [Candidatus Dormibacteraeota bacterium]|nr:hypothetical protein [Candidatus Dormibacteraeota bacterium]